VPKITYYQLKDFNARQFCNENLYTQISDQSLNIIYRIHRTRYWRLFYDAIKVQLLLVVSVCLLSIYKSDIVRTAAALVLCVLILSLLFSFVGIVCGGAVNNLRLKWFLKNILKAKKINTNYPDFCSRFLR
jgi:hypothetical protein